jgi:hypothetical protein
VGPVLAVVAELFQRSEMLVMEVQREEELRE